MYIHRIILRDAHNFDKLDITLYDELQQKPLNSVLLMGPNGSGKTTLLRIIAALWDSFGEWVRLDEPLKTLHPLLADANLVAIEIKQAYPVYGLGQATFPFILYPDDKYFDSTWLFSASSDKNFEKLKKLVNKQHEKDAIFIGAVAGEKIKLESEIEKAWMRTIEKHKVTLEVGGASLQNIHNMIFLDTKNRQILAPKESRLPSPTPESLYRWFIIYEGTDSWEGHIETMLRNMKLRNPLEFGGILDNINQFFGGIKKVLDIDNYLRINVEIISTGKIHPISELSSGEQQCLIMMVMVSRWMMPGGVVLIDEPDLHLHVSLQRQLISAIEKIVHERGGQLIVASHSPEMWDKFFDSQKIRLKLDVEELVHE